jgi:hypothetical protein
VTRAYHARRCGSRRRPTVLCARTRGSSRRNYARASLVIDPRASGIGHDSIRVATGKDCNNYPAQLTGYTTHRQLFDVRLLRKPNAYRSCRPTSAPGKPSIVRAAPLPRHASSSGSRPTAGGSLRRCRCAGTKPGPFSTGTTSPSERDLRSAAALLSAHHKQLHKEARTTKSLQRSRSRKAATRRSA